MSDASVLIPKPGQGITEGSIAEWLHEDGHHVIEGEALYVLETDKVELEVDSPATGTLKILVDGVGPFDVGTEIARIITD